MSNPISARKHGSNLIHSKGPDVCKTPMGSSMVPVPYMSFVTLAASQRTATSVFNNGAQDYTLTSRSPGVTGHEPGVGKGQVKAGYKQWANAQTAGPNVFSEGHAVIRDGDPAWVNGPDKQGPPAARSKSTSETDHH
jgi:hypothetical protein